MRSRFQKSESIEERSGRIAEHDFIGSIDTENPAYQTAYREFVSRNAAEIEKMLRKAPLKREEEELLFAQSVRLAETFTREDPRNPGPPLLRDLRLAIIDHLEFNAPEQSERVSAFSSVGTPLDYLLGTDGFIRIDGSEKGKKAEYITFDYSINEQKTKTRADILITQLPDPDLEETKYVKKIDEIATDFVRMFLRKHSQKPRPPREYPKGKRSVW